MKFLGLTLTLILGLDGCISHPPSQVPDAFLGLVGNWDEEHAESCKSPHVLSFNEEKTMMSVTYADAGWVTEDDSRKVFHYKILSANPSALRMQLENEPRLDNAGKPVVWQLVLVDADTYCWGRDDWPQGACTSPRKRCSI